jgi:hypothetical protein
VKSLDPAGRRLVESVQVVTLGENHRFASPLLRCSVDFSLLFLSLLLRHDRRRFPFRKQFAA